MSELRFRPEHLTSAVETILRDSRYRAKAEEQREVVESFDGPSTGARLIDELIGNGP